MVVDPKNERRILLIEEDYGNRVLFTDFLKYCGYTVMSLADGVGYLEAVASFAPSIILLDLKLPGVDGLTILETLKQHPVYKQVPVLVVSGYAFKTDRTKAMSLGAAGYLVKPIQPEVLKTTIESLLAPAFY